MGSEDKIVVRIVDEEIEHAPPLAGRTHPQVPPPLNLKERAARRQQYSVADGELVAGTEQVAERAYSASGTQAGSLTNIA